MGVNFTSLADCITKSDHVNFLRSYMQLVIAGKKLSVPTSLEYSDVKDAWSKILYGVPGGYSQAFLINLTNLWLKVLKSQGGTISEAFPREVLDILDDKPVAKKEEKPKVSSSNSKVPGITMVDPETVKRTEIAKNDKTFIRDSISRDYYEDKASRQLNEEKLPPSKATQAINLNKIDDFLLIYLSEAKNQTKPKLPMSSVLDIIYHKWRDIIVEKYGEMPSHNFLKAVSSRWFYIVNQKGLPISQKKIKDLIHFLITDVSSQSNDSNEKDSKSKKKGFWK